MNDLFIALSTMLFLGIASLFEWRTKRVPNWLTLGAFGVSTVWQIAAGGWTWLIAVVWVICFAAWQAGALGGGDAKVLMALATLRPDWRYLAWLVIGSLAWYSVVLIRRQPGPIAGRLQSAAALVTDAIQAPRGTSGLQDPFVVVVTALTVVYWLAVAPLGIWRATPGWASPG